MKRFIITEEEKKNILGMYGLINEQLSLLTINSENILFSTGITSKQIKLSGGIDPKTKKPMVLSYNIQGTYTGINFGVEMRNIKRLSNKSLYLEVQPTNRIVRWAMRKAIPVQGEYGPNQTDDQWLIIIIESDKINEAINQLKQNKGEKSVIDAGRGVNIFLTRVK